MRNRRLVAIALLAATCGACTSAKPRHLFVDRRGDTVHVVLRAPSGWRGETDVAMPLSDCGFFRIPAADEEDGLAPPEEIWRVTSLSPDFVVPVIRYGFVPEGFTQVTPPAGRAPALERGTRYAVECSGYGIGIAEFQY